jgi:hypothetical protein
LQTGKALHPQVGPRGGSENEATPRCLFEGDARLRDLGIFFERPGERGVEGETIRVRYAEDKGAD